MASEQWPAWFRLTVVSGVKVIVKKYVSGINLSDCIGDLIMQHLDDEYSGSVPSTSKFPCEMLIFSLQRTRNQPLMCSWGWGDSTIRCPLKSKSWLWL